MMAPEQEKQLVEAIRDRGYDGELRMLTIEDAQFIVRAPSRAEYALFIEGSSDAKKKAKAIEGLAKACVLYPTRDEYVALVEKRSGLPTTILEKVLELAGAGASVEEKKL